MTKANRRIGAAAWLLLAGSLFALPPGLWAQADSVSANGVTLVYEVQGNGEPLVLIHGWAVNRRYWDGTAELLARDYRVIRYDRRGYGESGGTPDPTADPADLEALLDALGHPRAHVLGHSAGAGVALTFAGRYPERVDRLILFGSGRLPGFAPAREGAFFEELAGIARTQGMDSVRAAIVKRAEERGGPRTPEVRERGRRLLESYRGLDLVDPAPPSGLVEPITVSELGSVRAPTLVVLGADEGPYLHLAAHALAYGIPDARKVVIPGGGHTVDWVEPERFVAEVLRFLRGADEPPGS